MVESKDYSTASAYHKTFTIPRQKYSDWFPGCSEKIDDVVDYDGEEDGSVLSSFTASKQEVCDEIAATMFGDQATFKIAEDKVIRTLDSSTTAGKIAQTAYEYVAKAWESLAVEFEAEAKSLDNVSDSAKSIQVSRSWADEMTWHDLRIIDSQESLASIVWSCAGFTATLGVAPRMSKDAMRRPITTFVDSLLPSSSLKLMCKMKTLLDKIDAAAAALEKAGVKVYGHAMVMFEKIGKYAVSDKAMLAKHPE